MCARLMTIPIAIPVTLMLWITIWVLVMGLQGKALLRKVKGGGHSTIEGESSV